MITIWKRDEKTEVEMGINGEGQLYLCNKSSGYNLPDTKENREYIRKDFKRSILKNF